MRNAGVLALLATTGILAGACGGGDWRTSKGAFVFNSRREGALMELSPQ
jgi:hypothetical protein